MLEYDAKKKKGIIPLPLVTQQAAWVPRSTLPMKQLIILETAFLKVFLESTDE